MIKVIHLLTSSSLSGAERVALDIIRWTSGVIDGWYASPRGPIEGVASRMGVRFIGLGRLGVSEVKQLIREHGPAVIHAHDYRASVVAAAASHGTGVRVVSHLHGDWKWARRINMRTIAYRAASRWISRVIVVSPAIIEHYRFSQSLRTKTEVMPNQVDIARVVAAAGRSPCVLSDLAFVGRLEDEKQPEVFIRIVAEVKRIVPNVRAVMVGAGRLEAKCRRLIKGLGLQDNVVMIGFTDNPYCVIAGSKVLVVPSAQEGFGLVALEAMALGVPVVCSAVGGLAYVVENRRSGLTGFGAKELAEHVVTLLRDERLRLRLGGGARARAEEFGDVARYASRMAELYQRL